jgi:hypothetical protein
MKKLSKEKQGAMLLLRIILWVAALLFLFLGISGAGSSGLWSNKGGFGGSMNIPSEGFFFFAVLMFLFDWVIRKTE